MKFGICAAFQQVATFKTIPFDYLEESVQRFLLPERPQADFDDLLQQARQLPVPITTANAFLPGDLFIVATPSRLVDTIRLEKYVRTALQRAEQAGIRVIVFGSGTARACPEGYDKQAALEQITDHLAQWSRWASNHGVTIALEPLRYAETNTINTVAEGIELLKTINSPGATLLADTYHMSCNHESPDILLKAAHVLSHVHVAEVEQRAAPGTSDYDFSSYFQCLQEAGYDQRISIECRWKDLETEATTAISFLRQQWAACTNLL